MITVWTINYKTAKKKRLEAPWLAAVVASVATTRSRATVRQTIALSQTSACATMAAARWRKARAITYSAT